MEKNQTPSKRLTATQRRELLVAAALRVMRRDGVAAATTRAICAEAEMPQSAFHYCFHTKKDLYRALLATETEFDLDGIWPTITKTTNPAEQVLALLIAMWEGIEKFADAQLVLFELSDLALRDPELADLAVWEQHSAVTMATKAINRLATETGIALPMEVGNLAELVVATLDGVARAWLRHRDNNRARQTLADFAATITR
jgi:AcrR family transcriptional regulator